VRLIAWAKNFLAASLFRRSERKTSMTWPNWSMARNRVAPGPSDLQVGLIDVPAITDDVPSGSCGLGELWSKPLDPPVHRHVIDLDPALG
jgi:hypothetical protein